MKSLLLLRHAKSSWDDPRLADFDRPLNDRGRRAAPLVGRHMRERKIRPDLVVCSPAERARRTIALVAEAAGLSAPVRFDERVYEATAAGLLEVVSQVEDAAGEVLLVGHNPGMEELLELLTGEARRMPTAALARVRLDIDNWSQLRPRAGRLEWHVKPKEL
ncbi:MAG TPA: histidine phosphatase family protein [Pyrinomonadaceae bacterium]|nr:histidine phosphatase family protein [Pyrinomonadaceae bacterium]